MSSLGSCWTRSTSAFLEQQELISIPASLPSENIKIKSEILLSPLQQAIKRANEEGKHIPGFSEIYPVFENAQQQRYYEPLPFKQLKELKMVCAQYCAVYSGYYRGFRKSKSAT